MARIVCWLSLDIPVVVRRSRIDAPTAAKSVAHLADRVDRGFIAAGGTPAQHLQLESSALGLFMSTRQALVAAVDLQRMLVGEGWPARMVLFLSEQEDPEYIDGDVLQRAEMLRAQVPEGAIVAESATAMLMGELTPDDGAWTLIGPSETTYDTLMLLDHPSLPKPPTELLDRRSANNLPRRLTALIGRDEDVAGVTERFYLSRLVTVTGPGGIGKSRVTVQAAYDLLERQPDGVWWLDCTAAASVDTLAESLLSILPNRREGEDSPRQRLKQTLRERELLIVLDNAEESLESVGGLIEEVTETCPNVAFLVSSRKPLRVVGESVYRLGSLATDGPDAPATQLFLNRIRLNKPDFEPSAAQAKLIRSVCRALDGFPLAIEIAASLHPEVSLSQIERRVTQDILELKLKRKGASATLDAVVGWGYDSLRVGDRAVLRALSVFPDEFTDAMAAAIIDSKDMAHALRRLVDASLLEATESGYRWLNPIRAVALRALKAAGEESPVRQRICTFLVRELESLYDEPRPFAEWIATCDQLHSAALDAVAWLLRGPIRDDTAFRVVYGLYDYWYSQGRFAEGESIARRVLAKSQSRPIMERVRLFSASGLLRMQQGAHRDAAVDLRNALELAREVANLVVESKTLCNYALALCRIPRLDEALVAANEATRLWPDHGNAHVHATNLVNLANIHLCRREFSEALVQIAKLRELGVPNSLEHNCDLTEASLWSQLGRAEEAQPVLERLLLLYIGRRDTRLTLTTLILLVTVLAQQGLYRQAATVSGLVDQLQQQFTLWVAPCSIERYQEAMDRCRAKLGEDFESEIAVGRDVTIEEFGDFLNRRGAPSLESTEDER